MKHRQIVAALALVALALVTCSCADLVGALTGRQAPTVQTTSSAASPAPRGPEAHRVTVLSLTAIGDALRVDGSFPMTMGSDPLSVFVDRCVLDQVGYGACASGGVQSPESYSPTADSVTFEHVVQILSTDLRDFLLVRPQGGQRPAQQVLSPWLRLVWSGTQEVEVRPLGTHAATVAVEVGPNGTLAAASLPALECYDASTRRWDACVGPTASAGVLLVRLGTPGAGRLLDEMKEAIGPEHFYGTLFPNTPAACDWRTEGVRGYDGSVSDALAEQVPDDPSAALEAAEALYGTWWNVVQQAQLQDAAALAACGWSITAERKEAVVGRLLELATRAGPAAASGELAQWAELACEDPGAACDQLTALRDARRQVEDEEARQREEQQHAVDEFFARADALQATCDQCTEGVQYDNRQLQFDCNDNGIDEACRRLNGIVQSRCAARCAPSRRCNECIQQFADMADERGNAAAERQAAQNCDDKCR